MRRGRREGTVGDPYQVWWMDCQCRDEAQNPVSPRREHVLHGRVGSSSWQEQGQGQRQHGGGHDQE